MMESLLRGFSPFGTMKDVSLGTAAARIAAYRDNRRRRGELAACMRRWALALAAAALLTQWFDSLGGAARHVATTRDVFIYLAAACATFLVCGFCVLLVTAYVYLYLSTHDG